MDDLRQRTSRVLLIDRLEPELKDMVENSSGCAFVSLIRTMTLLNSPAILDRNSQNNFLNTFKNLFGSLSTSLPPADFVKLLGSVDLGIKIKEFLYNINLATPQEIENHLSSNGVFPLEFKISPFRESLLKSLDLEPNQIAIIGVESAEKETGHYLVSDRSNFLTGITDNPDLELKTLKDEGYGITEILIFERS